MKYATLIYIKPGSHDTDITEEEHAALSAEYAALRQEPQCVGGGHLQPVETATSVRGDGLITDGPFAETREFLAGFNLIEAADIDEAMRIAQQFPWARFGSIEVRPVRDMGAVRERVGAA